MLIKTLVENTSISESFASEHGLSLYVETKAEKLLFDVGASDLFRRNAKKLDVDIADVDALVISHGHFDHGGGLATFLKKNKTAKVYLHPLAFEQYYASRPNDRLDYIGLDTELRDHEQVVYTSERFSITDNIYVFSNVPQREALPKSNRGLFIEEKGQKIADRFAHEQSLVVKEDGRFLLITGCAHNGILNILWHFQSLEGRMPDFVVGGFHLSSRSGGQESPEEIDKIATTLIGTGAKFYTCHCTGLDVYKRMKSAMGSQIEYLSAGSEVTL
ncbi:MAG: MBL fold metallo-hydrolase [Bacillota bacterium]|nr:MBL fold metallo-hydrolase [Bacillota bacterium]